MPTESGLEPVSGAGCEWVVEAHGCREDSLRDLRLLETFFREIVGGLGLHPVGTPLLHAFPGAGGVTGLWLLAESHLACHTFPEHRSLCFNLFCCRPRPDGDLPACITRVFGAESVRMRRIDRPYRDTRSQ